MALTRAFAIDKQFPNAADGRKAFGSLYPREGVFPDATVTSGPIAYAGTGWGVNATPFGAALKRMGVPFEDTYGTALVANDATVAPAWTIPGAPVSGSRMDLLCIRAKDDTQGDSLSGAPTDGPGGVARAITEWVYVTGTPGAPGLRPSTPAGYFEVAQAVVPSGAVSAAGVTFTATYQFAHVIGGPLVFRTLAELQAYTNANYTYSGMEAYSLDFPKARFVFVNGAWEYLVGRGSYTPTWSRLTVGNAVQAADYERVGNWTKVRGSLILGSTTSLSAASGLNTVGVSLPFTATTRYGVGGAAYNAGQVTILDNGVQIYYGPMFIGASTSEAKMYFGNPRAAVNSGAPAGLSSGDIFSYEFAYEAAP